MECIKRIALSGRTVVCTIHQPSTVLFELFDKLLLLKTGGEMVYFGDLGKENVHLLDYFSTFHGINLIKPTENPATYMLDCIGAGTGATTIDIDFAAVYKESPLGMVNEALVARWSKPSGERHTKPKKYEASFGRQFALLLDRQMTTNWRTPSYNISRAVPMHGRHESDGHCHVHAAGHSLSLALVKLLYCVVLSAIFFNVTYWICGHNQATDAWVWFLVSLVSSMVVVSYTGHLLLYVMPTMPIVVVLSSAVASLMFIFSGFMIDGNTLAKGWQWMYWISPEPHAQHARNDPHGAEPQPE
ncbi:Aste57867_18246 [Aphanomyces stellatus]|uniref:Aste57867_18246 protein n=1 Tax=Aphanomyces stellatus TaxID=120398 RepID=A0A485L9Y2_9STRA|nr:hypothetical protein As57867_018184 [Aphanomyces stellatus]VFT94983.1 Aste57867_18246 [Aphanomyces stellatus]